MAATRKRDPNEEAKQSDTKSSEERGPTLYCRNFPAELKERCEGIAGFLGKSISEFVAEILEEETKDMKETHEAVKQWYERRSRNRGQKT